MLGSIQFIIRTIHPTKISRAGRPCPFIRQAYHDRMTILPDPRKLDVENLGLPAWAWPVLGLTVGLTLVVVVYGTCFIDPQCK
jgi:hypothetical protein